MLAVCKDSHVPGLRVVCGGLWGCAGWYSVSSRFISVSRCLSSTLLLFLCLSSLIQIECLKKGTLIIGKRLLLGFRGLIQGLK